MIIIQETFILVAVVIVFTVCQIPQAISLIVQSFFPSLSRTSKVLIYNNFANCFVALNASTNFLLYCCFSDRFRTTFRSSFAFQSKYCTHYFQSKGYVNNKRRRHPHSCYHGTLSLTDSSSYFPHRNQLNTRISTSSTELDSRHYHPIHQRQSRLINENDHL